jgi:hypothetical protein
LGIRERRVGWEEGKGVRWIQSASALSLIKELIELEKVEGGAKSYISGPQNHVRSLLDYDKMR